MLSQRLKTLAHLIPSRDVIVVDVGTDHAQLPIYLVQTRKLKKVYAVDLRAEPLKIARRNVAQAHLSTQIPTLQANGLEVLSQLHEPVVDYCVIAGLGTTTILEILSQDNERIQNYLICANTDVWPLRKWANQKNYTISHEEFLTENNRFYWIIALKKPTSFQPCQNEEFGDFFWHQKNQIYQKYLTDFLIHQTKISQQVNNKTIQKQFIAKIKRIQEYLKLWN